MIYIFAYTIYPIFFKCLLLFYKRYKRDLKVSYDLKTIYFTRLDVVYHPRTIPTPKIQSHFESTDPPDNAILPGRQANIYILRFPVLEFEYLSRGEL